MLKNVEHAIRRLPEPYWRWAGTRNRERNSNTRIIAVTGSSAKSTVALLLAHILNEVGKPHVQVFRNSLFGTAKTLHSLPRDADWCVMEIGLAAPGQVERMARLVRPHIGIVTAIGLDHYKSFRSRENIAEDKGALVEQVQPGGFVVLNSDDEHVMSMAPRTKERIVTFGQNQAADYKVQKISSGLPNRLSLALQTPKGYLELQTRFAAAHHYLAVTAAVSCALELGIEPEVVRQQVENFEPLWDRCQPLEIPGGPTLLIDTFKAPAYSFGLALDTLDSAQYSKKRVVIGQISDYPGNSKRAVRKVKKLAEAVADQVIFIGYSPRRMGVNDSEIASGKYKFFDNIREATKFLQDTGSSDEIILLKSSQKLHLERAALAWLAEVDCWVDQCVKRSSCLKCDRYLFDFALHRGFVPPALLNVMQRPDNSALQQLKKSMKRSFIR